jgi:regulator of protease activity HflC (stomatin/prohibitin superfamily)
MSQALESDELMQAEDVHTRSEENEVSSLSGWLVLPFVLFLYVASFFIFAQAPGAGTTDASGNTSANGWVVGVGIIVLIVALAMSWGFYTLQPNEARVLILFGNYKGTVRHPGFKWGNPLYANGAASKPPTTTTRTTNTKGESGTTVSHKPMRRYKVSLRARTLNGERLKVNDRRGNPVDIAAVVVWRVHDTAKSVFDVDDVETYVATQSETSVRHLATTYPYDADESVDNQPEEVTLRGNVDEVSDALRRELSQRLAPAGVTVDQARLTHLAYAPEIAQTMLRRQQAEAVIAARRKIVTGAVSMVEMALDELTTKGVLELDQEHKATMVSNLMVVLCGESSVTPVVNTGTLSG